MRRRCYLWLSQLERRSQCLTSKHERTGCLSCKGLRQLAIWSWNQCSLTISKMLGPFRIILHLLFLCCINGTSSPRCTQLICLQHDLLNILSPCWDLLLKEKISLKILLFFDNVPGHSWAPMKINNMINIVFMPANTNTFCGPWIKE